MFGGNFAPRGWAFCNGQLLSIAANSALFSIIGTAYGGDGRTTFALPDLRGRVPLSPGQGPGLSHYAQGEKGGHETVTLQTSQIPSHNHGLQGSSNQVDQASPANGFLPSSPRGGANLYAGSIGTAQNMGNSITNTGGGGSHENRQPYLGVYYIIALQGIFPSRG